ncbi:hypothetical protein MHBO_000920 [Bonamia ostreae]|uniref:Coenzyme Q-binding protein COQ10 START domain-containing protein n=1 Tax=Bonamia ostreae TaxID=126728 RepID=A0ABV2AH90_9EUKA
MLWKHRNLRKQLSKPLGSKLNRKISLSSESKSYLHKESDIFRQPPETVYSVFSKVGNYRHFLPLLSRSVCEKAPINAKRPIIKRTPFIKIPTNSEHYLCDMAVGIAGLQENYKADVFTKPFTDIVSIARETETIEYLDTIFKLEPVSKENFCLVNFECRFKFKSPALNLATDYLFHVISRELLSKFKKECRKNSLIKINFCCCNYNF